MIYSLKHKFLFIKTRKTAGSTLEGVLYPILGSKDVCTGSQRDGTPNLNCKPNSNGHVIIDTKTIPSDFLSFSIERNPFDKVVSSYFWHLNMKPNIFGQMSFPEYIDAGALLPLDWDAYQNCDVVFKYEEMQQMYQYLSNYTKTDLSIQDAHALNFKSEFRKKIKYQDLHTPETIRKVQKLFSREISRFGYEF
ncbi:sulfotransferase family protein [Rhodobacteraceae bacterium]|nr:sulfotransferase family protein [Paracoccaceae bacterium]